ncbi:hypothetical protein M9Y10_044865 [Tritrichomonas musculus]|uniref:Uncharacterized protein n=1 Tax=Tritrichomonas musculus TaxID=1915356 RepID=A0ABR2JTL4_9EUKA
MCAFQLKNYPIKFESIYGNQELKKYYLDQILFPDKPSNEKDNNKSEKSKSDEHTNDDDNNIDLTQKGLGEVELDKSVISNPEDWQEYISELEKCVELLNKLSKYKGFNETIALPDDFKEKAMNYKTNMDYLTEQLNNVLQKISSLIQE